MVTSIFTNVARKKLTVIPEKKTERRLNLIGRIKNGFKSAFPGLNRVPIIFTE
jgi:hypothetical protein